MGFTKLDERILQSSIMAAKPKTFKVWIALLAACDPDGIARVSETFLSRVCYLSLSDVRRALQELSSPDPSSRTPDREGRRIERVNGGYYIVNYEKYRASAIYEGYKEMERMRWKERSLRRTPEDSGELPECSASASASASDNIDHKEEGGMGGEEKKPSKPPKINFNFETSEWENISEQDIKAWEEAFPAVDITAELSKAKSWLLANPEKRKKNYRRFLHNWFARTQERGGTKGIIRASRVGESKLKMNYPPGYWDKVLELKNKGVSGEALHEELQKIPEFKAFFQNRPGGQA